MLILICVTLINKSVSTSSVMNINFCLNPSPPPFPSPHTCIVFPNNCSLSVVAMGDKYEQEARIDFWDNVQGKCTQATACKRDTFVAYVYFLNLNAWAVSCALMTTHTHTHTHTLLTHTHTHTHTLILEDSRWVVWRRRCCKKPWYTWLTPTPPSPPVTQSR